MSNDSALNSIAGRILLARARADSTESTAENYKRIDESEFLEDLKTHAAGSDYLKTEDEMWLKETIRNYDPEWGSEINTALMTAQRRPFA